MQTVDKRLTSLEVKFEHFEDKLDAILEVVIPTHKDLQDVKSRLSGLEKKLDNVEIRTEILEEAVTSHTAAINLHTKEIQQLKNLPA